MSGTNSVERVSYQERWRWIGGIVIALAIGLIGATWPEDRRGEVLIAALILLPLGLYVGLAPGTRFWRSSHLIAAYWGPPGQASRCRRQTQ
jgi:hypothetical protein